MTVRVSTSHDLTVSDLTVSYNRIPALHHLSFRVRCGQCVALLGPNGAGKSTLLKILSRITEPTSGRITLNGRVASLLEVGTGFHPELTGRENIFLNGAILGMSRSEIRKKFDEIVAFSEVERFLDTPVKRYSSGMYVRLAFAVAAHLEPEILIVDEVLAVGDSAFQKKCLGKLQNVSRQEGRTVLLVSHNLGQVRNLCSRVLLLRGGGLDFNGDASEALARYQTRDAASQPAPALQGPLAEVVRLHNPRLAGSSVGPTQCERGDHVQLEFDIELKRPLTQLRVTVALFVEGSRLNTTHESAEHAYTSAPAGRLRITCRLPLHLLQPGHFEVGLGFCDGHPSLYAWTPSAFGFEVLEDSHHRGPREETGYVTLPLVIERHPRTS